MVYSRVFRGGVLGSAHPTVRGLCGDGGSGGTRGSADSTDERCALTSAGWIIDDGAQLSQERSVSTIEYNLHAGRKWHKGVQEGLIHSRVLEPSPPVPA